MLAFVVIIQDIEVFINNFTKKKLIIYYATLKLYTYKKV